MSDVIQLYANANIRITELERENSALRDAIQESEEFARKNGETCGSKIRELLRENAALREALDSAIVLLRRWNKNDVNDDVVIETRKAIYAARKEAQP